MINIISKVTKKYSVIREIGNVYDLLKLLFCLNIAINNILQNVKCVI